jgi:Rrf2 family protein
MLHNRTTQTAIAAMSRLAELYDQSATASSKDIAESRGLPVPVVAKILTELSRAGWVTGAPGPRGGYRLAFPPQEITLYDIVDLFERETHVACAFGPSWCGTGDPCPLHESLTNFRQKELEYCQKTTLAIFQKQKTAGKSSRKNRKQSS